MVSVGGFSALGNKGIMFPVPTGPTVNNWSGEVTNLEFFHIEQMQHRALYLSYHLSILLSTSRFNHCELYLSLIFIILLASPPS